MSNRQEGGARLHQDPKRGGSAAPLISIVTVTFNAVQHLPDTLKTIRAQDYPNVEWIVIDGGSTDGTTDYLRANEDVIDYWMSAPDRGMYDALAKGFERANGEILCWLNAGDMFLNGALSTVAEVFQTHPETNWITGMHFWHLPGCRIIGCFIPQAYSSDLIGCGAYGKRLPYIQQESTFFRRSMLGGINMERFRGFKLAGDLYLWHSFSKHDRLRLVMAGLGSFCIQEGQLSEDKEAYWREADTFLDRITLALRIKMLMRFPLSYAPLRYKRKLAGDAMLSWVKGKGWV
jgi:glycosyltransferase involved in cell wall biosynthesis